MRKELPVYAKHEHPISPARVGVRHQRPPHPVACVLTANTALTQVLFFKREDAHAAIEAATRSAVIIHSKIIACQENYLSSIIDV